MMTTITLKLIGCHGRCAALHAHAKAMLQYDSDDAGRYSADNSPYSADIRLYLVDSPTAHS